MTVGNGHAKVPALLRLHEADNVAMATRTLEAGEGVEWAGTVMRIERRTPVGHKVAIRPIAAGERVIKFRVPIGSATTPIAAGGYVHTHNLKSDYIATYTFEKGKRFEEDKH